MSRDRQASYQVAKCALEACQEKEPCTARDDKSLSRTEKVGGRLIKAEIRGAARATAADKAYSPLRMDRFRFRSLYGTLRPSDVLRLLNQ